MTETLPSKNRETLRQNSGKEVGEWPLGPAVEVW